MTVVRDTASVFVSEPVDGSPRRAERAAEQRARSSRVELSRCAPELLAAARAALRPGERLVIVDESTVRTTYR
jgi:hypothetical protein